MLSNSLSEIMAIWTPGSVEIIVIAIVFGILTFVISGCDTKTIGALYTEPNK